MILQLKGVNKSFIQGQTRIDVLKNLNFEVGEGETVGILGPSGSGKTTLLTMISGLDHPDSGDVLFENSSLVQLSEEQITAKRAKDIGIVFQQYHLLPYLTAIENIRLPIELNGLGKIEETADTLIASMGLENRKNHFPHQMSGGENQRIAIARAFATRPKIVVADEPTGSLDQKTGDMVMDYLFKVIQETKTTLLLVTHNEQIAKRCNRQVRLHDGQLHEI